MSHLLDRLRLGRSQFFDVGICLVGLVILVWSTVMLAGDGWDVTPVALLAVPLTVLISRFPVVIGDGDGGIEVGFDSAVMIMLAYILDPYAAIVIWSLGVLAAQLSLVRKRTVAKVFNIGSGIVAGSLAIAITHLGDHNGSSSELLLTVIAAVAYFAIDWVLSAVSIALELAALDRPLIFPSGGWLAMLYVVPFDLSGYLAALIIRLAPTWSLVLLVVPLGALLIATRAISHSRENARGLQVLLEAAVDSQTHSEPRQVTDSLVEYATRLLKTNGCGVRSEPPGTEEIGAQVRGGDPMWVVAPSRANAQVRGVDDERALEALAAVATAALSRLALTEKLVHLARFDPLTQLANRAVFLDRVTYALLLGRRRKQKVALLFVDLDGFKPVNDRFGHAAGDAVLVDVARRLQEVVRDTDTVARLGGDEFAVFFEDVQPGEVTAACERIVAALSGGVEAGEHQVTISASIGVAVGAGGANADELLRNADLAMYEAKAQGKNRYVIYEPRMLESRLERLELVEALESALDADEITVVYQPVVVAETDQICGVEALARWSRAGVAVPPDVFIPVAEQTGMIGRLGALVLDQASRDAALMREAAGGDINVGVNVAPSQLADADFVIRAREAIARMGQAGLVLEVTEREGIGRDSVLLQTMRDICDLGATFAIDDFGTGFSSISYLQQMPVEIVKVDASLSRYIDSDAKARGLLRSITMMSQALGHEVVIEGIERESQMDLIRHDVTDVLIQGFLKHRPMPLDTLLVTLKANRAQRVPAPART